MAFVCISYLLLFECARRSSIQMIINFSEYHKSGKRFGSSLKSDGISNRESGILSSNWNDWNVMRAVTVGRIGNSIEN